MTLWCFTAALRECRLDECRECWAAKLAPEIGSNSPKASATMAILVLGHIVVTPVWISTGACDKVRRADHESYDHCVHVTVFNVAVFDRGDENSLEALMQSAQCGDAAQQLYRSNRKPMRRFLRMKRACPTASAMLTTGQPDLGKRKSDAHP